MKSKVNNQAIKDKANGFFNILSRTKRFFKNIVLTTTKLVITVTYHVVAGIEYLSKELEGVLRRIKENQKRRCDSNQDVNKKIVIKYIKRMRNIDFLINMIKKVNHMLENINDTVDEVVEWIDEKTGRKYSSAELLTEKDVNSDDIKRHPHEGSKQDVSFFKNGESINAGYVEYSYRELGKDKFRFEIRYDDDSNPEATFNINNAEARRIGKKLFCNEVLNRIYQDQFNNKIKPEF